MVVSVENSQYFYVVACFYLSLLRSAQPTVLLVNAAPTIQHDEQQLDSEQERVLSLLLRECSIKTAVALAVEITGGRKKLLYQAALEMAKTAENLDD